VSSSDDLCVITAGTTGQPKGAMLTHGNILWNAINMLTAGPGLSRNDVTIVVAPLFHIGALGLSVLPLLHAGGTAVVQQSFRPERTLERSRERKSPPSSWCPRCGPH
jgi:fatty-acyl-CoA synthase